MLSQIVDSNEYELGGKKFSGKELKEAIIKFQKSLTNKEIEFNNEIVGYAPKIKGVIAKEKSLENVPVELLDYAKENNLPVILI